jgi:hypothetical protein
MYEENFNHAIEEFFQLETDNYKEILEESKIEVYYITAHSQVLIDCFCSITLCRVILMKAMGRRTRLITNMKSI